MVKLFYVTELCVKNEQSAYICLSSYQLFECNNVKGSSVLHFEVNQMARGIHIALALQPRCKFITQFKEEGRWRVENIR